MKPVAPPASHLGVARLPRPECEVCRRSPPRPRPRPTPRRASTMRAPSCACVTMATAARWAPRAAGAALVDEPSQDAADDDTARLLRAILALTPELRRALLVVVESMR